MVGYAPGVMGFSVPHCCVGWGLVPPKGLTLLPPVFIPSTIYPPPVHVIIILMLCSSVPPRGEAVVVFRLSSPLDTPPCQLVRSDGT